MCKLSIRLHQVLLFKFEPLLLCLLAEALLLVVKLQLLDLLHVALLELHKSLFMLSVMPQVNYGLVYHSTQVLDALAAHLAHLLEKVLMEFDQLLAGVRVHEGECVSLRDYELHKLERVV